MSNCHICGKHAIEKCNPDKCQQHMHVLDMGQVEARFFACMTSRANYNIEVQEFVEAIGKRRVVIRDLGPWDQHPTVTNDADAVVHDLTSVAKIVDGDTQLLYYDSEG